MTDSECNFEATTLSVCPECDCETPESIVVTLCGTPVYTDLPPVICEITERCGGKRKVPIPWDNEAQCWRARIDEQVFTLFHVQDCDQCPTTTTPPETP